MRALWQARDELAEQRDIAPGRLLPDAAIVEAALAAPRSRAALARLPGFHGRGSRAVPRNWWRALEAAYRLPEDELPIAASSERRTAADPRMGGARSGRGRPAGGGRTASPRSRTSTTCRRRTCWPPTSSAGCAGMPSDRLTEDVVAEDLASMGARTWQVRITGGPVARALDRLRTRGEA